MKVSSGKRFVLGKRLFIYLVLCFVLLHPIMTLTHEWGHYFAMRTLGYKHAQIHFNSTDTGTNAMRAERHALHMRYKDAIDKHIPFPEEIRFNELGRQIDTMWNNYKTRKFDSKEAVIYAAGPLENMLTGTIGIILLLVFHRSFRQAKKLVAKQWAVIFTALFWLSTVFPLFAVFYQRVILSDPDTRTDWYKVSVHFGLCPWTLDIFAGIFGVLAVLGIFKFVPTGQRFTLLTALIIGTTLGKLLWMWLGPLLLP